MSQTRSRSAPTTSVDRNPRNSPWVGWIAFAGAIMVLLGTFHVFAGVVALFKDEYYLVGRSGLIVNADFTTWGWVHVIGGTLVILAGVGIFAGKLWARSVGVAVALSSALVNLAFLSAYPLWSLIMIVLDVVLIFALTVHGADIVDYGPDVRS